MPEDNINKNLKIDRRDVIDILMKKYAILKSDQIMQANSFKGHVRNSQLIATILIAIFATIYSRGVVDFKGSNIFLWMLLGFVITTVTFYLLHDILESSFAVHAIAERIVSIEIKINELVGAEILIWESQIAKELWTPLFPVKGLIHPIIFMLIYNFILVFLAGVALPLYFYYKIWNQNSTGNYIFALITILALYSLASAGAGIFVWCRVNRRLRPELTKLIQCKWHSFTSRTDR